MIRLLLIFVLMFISALAFGQQEFHEVAQEEKAFKAGEKLTYKLSYDLFFNMGVGELVMEVDEEVKKQLSAPAYLLKATGRSYSFYDRFFKVRDYYYSYVDTASLLPLVFLRYVNEGGYSKDEKLVFNQKKQTVTSNDTRYALEGPTLDVLSALYLARQLPLQGARPGQEFYTDVFLDDSLYTVGVEFIGREWVKTKAGTFKCLKLKPILIVDRIFDSEEDMTLWVTDDQNRIAVKVESGISVGSVVASLEEYSNLKYPLKARRD